VSIGRFQCGVAALLYHAPTETYLLLRRSGRRDFGANDWESVTGRVDQGESFEQAVYREVREEVGLEVRIDFIIGTTHFYRGEPAPENELLGVKYACSIGSRDALSISDEHDEARWLTANEIYALLPSNHWLYQTVQRAEMLREVLPESLIAYQQSAGFEKSD
jgi:8-oxo-dGTP diphosphatase